jgi:hypothetical protein
MNRKLMPRPKQSEVKRFYKHVAFVGACLVWKNVKGTPSFRYLGKTYHSHRWLWEVVKHHVPGHLQRVCATEHCVNPDHFREVRPIDDIPTLKGKRVPKPRAPQPMQAPAPKRGFFASIAQMLGLR